ncbi:hypothetical protein V3C99_001372 [Haemonchus contortus]
MAGIEENVEDTLRFHHLLIVSDDEEQGTTEEEVDDLEEDTESESEEETTLIVGVSGLHDAVYDCQEPIDFYELFLKREIMDLIVRETNRYGIRQNEEFQETSADEMRNYIDLCLQMGLVKMPNLRPCLGGQAGKILKKNQVRRVVEVSTFSRQRHL